MSDSFDYLLDTNIVSVLLDSSRPFHREANECLAKIGHERVFLSVISVGEINFGLKRVRVPNEKNLSQRTEVEEFIRKVKPKEFTKHVAEIYSDIRAELWRRNCPEKAKRKYVEDLFKKITERSQDCKTDERDLMIVSTAVAFNYILVTNDEKPDMMRIVEAAEAVIRERLPDSGFRVENWVQL